MSPPEEERGSRNLSRRGAAALPAFVLPSSIPFQSKRYFFFLHPCPSMYVCELSLQWKETLLPWKGSLERFQGVGAGIVGSCSAAIGIEVEVAAADLPLSLTGVSPPVSSSSSSSPLFFSSIFLASARYTRGRVEAPKKAL